MARALSIQRFVDVDLFAKALRLHMSRSPRARAIDETKKARIAPNIFVWMAQPNRYDIVGIDYPKSEMRKAINAHRSRSPRARGIDESRRARIALDISLWMRQPNSYDIVGIDLPKATVKAVSKKVSEPVNSKHTNRKQVERININSLMEKRVDEGRDLEIDSLTERIWSRMSKLKRRGPQRFTWVHANALAKRIVGYARERGIDPEAFNIDRLDLGLSYDEIVDQLEEMGVRNRREWRQSDIERYMSYVESAQRYNREYRWDPEYDPYKLREILEVF